MTEYSTTPAEPTPQEQIEQLRQTVENLQNKLASADVLASTLRGDSRRKLQEVRDFFAEHISLEHDDEYEDDSTITIKVEDINELMDSIGLQTFQAVREYRVDGVVTYRFEVVVKAKSEEDAIELVNDNLTTHSEPALQLDGVDDHEFDSIEQDDVEVHAAYLD